MNLYNVEFELVATEVNGAEVAHDMKLLPTHIIASSQSSAVEMAIRHSTRNFQLKRCYLNTDNVNILTEKL